MATPSATALKLLAELLEIDQTGRERRVPLTLAQKQRRQVLVHELRNYGLEHQAAPSGREQRRNPRADVKLRVQLLGGPRPVELESESLAVGGLSVKLGYAPRPGDLLPLRLLPAEPDAPLELLGEVVWYDPRQSRVGLRFHKPSDEVCALVERLVFGALLDGR